MMNQPKKACISKLDIMTYKLKLPGEKQIVLTRKHPTYTTSDPAELEFLSKQRGIVLKDLDDQEFRTWIQKQPFDKPLITNRELTRKQAEEFMFTSSTEDMIVDILKSKGYTVFQRKPRGEKDGD